MLQTISLLFSWQPELRSHKSSHFFISLPPLTDSEDMPANRTYGTQKEMGVHIWEEWSSVYRLMTFYSVT
jgi:hypothetical protein